LTQTGSEKLSTAIANPMSNEVKNITGKLPIVRKKIARVTTLNENAIIRSVPPIFATSDINNPAPAKQRMESEDRNEEAKELRWY
jgi:hypothetical protein